MKKFLAFGFIILSAICCTAQEKDLTINAASLAYDREKGIVEATGSVEAAYRKIRITGDHMYYNETNREAYLDSGFNLLYDGLELSGKTLRYNLNKEAGHATMTKIKYQKAIISGAAVDFDRETVKLKSSEFTACDQEYPHYHLTAMDIDLFEKQEWLVAYWGIFWLGSLPSVPIPVYVYDFKAEERGKKNVMPYPEVGNNNDDGTWIQETMSWHLRPDLNGNYSFNYASKKGMGGGFSASYLIDQDRDLESDIFVSASEGPRSGLSYSHWFGKNELNMRLLSRERINYERVSMLPDITFRFKGAELMKGRFEGSADIGQIGEESSNKWLNRGNILGILSYPIDGGFTLSGGLDASFYGNGTHWLKASGNIGYVKKLSDMATASLGYDHFFENRGQSPFNYEKYRFFPNDKVNLGLVARSASGKLALNYSYLLPDLSPQEIDYTAGITLHCFNIDLTYHAMRQEFILGFSLN